MIAIEYLIGRGSGEALRLVHAIGQAEVVTKCDNLKNRWFSKI
jgi:hypothetical protein